MTQFTDYHVLGSKDGTQWVEFTPRPRSKQKALDMLDGLKPEWVHARVERRISGCDIIKRRKPS